MSKKLFICLFIMMFGLMLNVKAIPSSLTLGYGNAKVNSDYGIVDGYDSEKPITFAYKYTNISGKDYLAFCTSSYQVSANFSTNAYSATNTWNNEVSAGIAEIIIRGVGENATLLDHSSKSPNLYITQLAIWKYVKDKGVYTENNLDYTIESLNQNQEDLHNKFNNLFTYASLAEEKIIGVNNFNPTLELEEITFTKQGDNYISNPVKINDNYIDSVTIDAPSYVTFTGNYKDGFVFKVPSNKLTSEKTDVNITFDVNSISVPLAVNYSTGESTYQTITFTQFDRKNSSKELSISGTIEIKPKLTIEKVDDKDVYLDGAIVKVTKNNNDFKEFTVVNGKIDILEDLTFNEEYCVTEIKSPDGYAISKIPECVTLTYSNPEKVIKITNVKTKLIINKLSKDNLTKLSGAILKLVDSDNNLVKYCKDSNNNLVDCIWETTSESFIIEGLHIGTYYLEEMEAPNGYNLSDIKVRIEVDSNGVIKINGKESSDGIINFENSLTKTIVNPISAVTEKELAGVTLEVLDLNKKSIPCTILNNDGEEENLERCSWISDDKPKTILGLSKGSYYLVELSAPDGYVLNKENIEFDVNAKGDVRKVEIINDIEVEVPDTLSSRSTLLLTISSILIFIGIAFMTSRKNRKA